MSDDRQDSRSEPVVVTGAHRSGTTLLGQIASRAVGTWTVWEPFNRHWGLAAVTVAYPYLRSGSAPTEPVDALSRYLSTGRGRWSAKHASGRRDLAPLRAAAKTTRRWVDWRRHLGAVAVIKDPFLLLALDAVQPRITPRPIVVSIRHPCSWLLSLRRMNWPAGPELNSLIAQSALYEEHLSRILPRKDWTEVDDLEAGARAWACLHHMLNVQVRAGANVFVVPMESFGRDPATTIESIYRATSLRPGTPPSALAAEYATAEMVTPDAGTRHLLQRNSRLLSDAWKTKLTTAEIARVRSLTEGVYGTFYAEWNTAEALPAPASAQI